MQQSRTSVRRFALLAMMFAIIAAMAVPAVGQTDGLPTVPVETIDDIKANKGPSTYIIWMVDDPVVAYDGSIRGLPATAVGPGQKLNPNSAAVKRYQQHLTQRANELLGSVGADTTAKVYQYSVVFSGFAAQLTPAQAARLSADSNVAAVFENEIQELDTSTTPDFLGLTDEQDGVWNDYQGEDVIIGIIDSGVWPENPSFSDQADLSAAPGKGNQKKNSAYGPPPAHWSGTCQSGEQFSQDDCNNKLIGARFYVDGFGNREINRDFPLEYLSPRDADGHGTHTASTAGGNSGVAAILADGTDLGTISGMAPRARVAAYKVCWGYFGVGGCATADSVAAIDQAVADGVDVINYSISGTTTNFLDPVEVAFLFAADVGVVVNASAGNEGPGASTVAHPSPWVTTVAAGTHDRAFENTVTTGDGETYGGVPSINNPGTPELPLVFAGDVALDGVDIEDAALCMENTLDPDQVAGKMVLCNRGVIARVAKSAEVARAGGLAMIHGNVGEGSLNADLHSVPTIHVDDGVRQDITLYIETAVNPTASMTAANAIVGVAPDVAAFSSRGPLAASGDLLKPDIMAPGVDVLASYSPRTGNAFDFLSGTSMSSPHMAGISALMKDAHPDWSPAMIKSALMTNATPLNNQGDPIPGGPFDYGSGQVVPNSAVDPGLVYDAGFLDYFGFLCGTGQLASSSCAALEIDPSDLNQPNIAIGELAGSQTVTRTVTNVGPAGTYEVSVDAPAGVDVAVSPETLTLAEGESASYTVTFTANESATIGEYTAGSLTWSHGPHNVRSQLVVKPVNLAAVDELSGEGTEGTLSYDVTFGYSGDFAAAAHGLEPATTQAGSVVDDPADDINVALSTGTGITEHVVIVPDGTAYTRISLFDAYTDGADDLDLYVFGPNPEWDPSDPDDSPFVFVGGSGSASSAEQVDLPFPERGNAAFVAAFGDAGLHLAIVHGWETDGPDANYTLFDWSVLADPTADDGSLAIDSAPAAATLGATESIEVSWSGLDAGAKYLGAVSYSDAGGVFGLTLVGVETD